MGSELIFIHSKLLAIQYLLIVAPIKDVPRNTGVKPTNVEELINPIAGILVC
jgi:hypothetical protein